LQNIVDHSAFKPRPYDAFDGQFIAGRWLAGTGGRTVFDRDPYNDAVLAEIAQASVQDLDRAFDAAKAAQVEWAATSPSARAEVFLRAVSILDARKEEIILWIIRESGSTRIKAGIEWGAVRAGMLEAATMPVAAQGHIIPVDRPGKEARIYKKPVGVVGVISPWNFPLHLSNRSVAPALALGNAVVLKPSNDTPVTGGLLLAKIYEEAGLPDVLQRLPASPPC
jgi:aldehyde dehydrogenase (NAD+)